MEIATLVLSAISTVSAVVSAVAAILAKNEVKRLNSIFNGNKNSQVDGTIEIKTKENSGTIVGVNTGKNEKRTIK